MAVKVRIEVNKAGVRELLRSQEVQDDLLARARRIAAAAGGEQDFAVEANLTTERARVVVVTATEDARIAEATNRSLTRAIDAGR